MYVSETLENILIAVFEEFLRIGPVNGNYVLNQAVFGFSSLSEERTGSPFLNVDSSGVGAKQYPDVIV